MKKAFCRFVAVSLSVFGVAALPAAASGGETLRVSVPFAFTAGSATLPPGEYVISQQTDGRILTIGGRNGGAILIATPQSGAGDLNVAGLKFERTSKGNMLREVQISGTSSVILNPAGK